MPRTVAPASGEWDTTHECPHPACSELVKRDMFACKTHWFQLPRDIRGTIWSSFRRGDLTAYSEATSAARQHYRDNAAPATLPGMP